MMKLSASHSTPAWRRLVWILPFLLFSFSACAADNAAELDGLYKALNMLNQEQQSIFQQFQMVQDMLRRNSQPPYGSQMQRMGDFPNYADVVEEQKSVVRREESLYKQADDLMTKYSQIEEEKKPLRERILSLTTSK